MSKRTLSETASVYVIGTPEGPQKIGVAGNVKQRLNAIRTGNPSSLRLHHDISMTRTEAVAVEAYAHWLLREQVAQGEWFAISPNLAIEAVQQAFAAVKANAPMPPNWRNQGRELPKWEDYVANPDLPRPRGRPRIHPPGTTGADRKRLHRLGQGSVQVELSAETALALDALAQRHADPSRAACVARLVREAG